MTKHASGKAAIAAEREIMIREVAYRRYQAGDRCEGTALDDWLAAEKEVDALLAVEPATAASSTSAHHTSVRHEARSGAPKAGGRQSVGEPRRAGRPK